MDGTGVPNWHRRESGPVDAAHTVLLLPGGMCTAAQYQELMNEPALADIHLVAVTLPGMGGTPALDDLGIENYARLTAGFAADVGADLVVGHSMGANVALEMVASGAFSGPVVLLAPSFRRGDESMVLRAADRASLVLRHLPYAAMLKVVGAVVKNSPVGPERRDELATMLRRNEPRIMRRAVHAYLKYLDRHHTVAPRLGHAGVPAWVVHGETGDGGVGEVDRRRLSACPDITMITIPGASVLTPNEVPALVADLIVQALVPIGRSP